MEDYESENEEIKEVSMQEFLLGLMSKCSDSKDVKYYWQYEFDSNLTNYERLMDNGSICIAANNIGDAEVMSIVLRVIIDANIFVLDDLLGEIAEEINVDMGIDDDEEDLYDTNIIIDMGQEVPYDLLVEKIKSRKELQKYYNHMNTEKPNHSVKIYDKAKMVKIIKDKKFM